MYRPPGGHANNYVDPQTVPAADIADNPYWKRDTRRQWPRQLVYTQQSVAGLLTLGNAAMPRISNGEAGTKELALIRDLKLVDVLSDESKIMEILKRTNGLPPSTAVGGHTWTLNESEGYPKGNPWKFLKRVSSNETEYPVRMFR